MKFSNHTEFVLVLLLIILSIIFHYPTTPHELGKDSFEIHSIANSVSTFGYAKWWIHPASIGGFYPYSYASAIPFILSSISQCTGMNMEGTIWLFCVLIGIFSAFTAYLMAGAIRDDDFFKYLVAFAYSTSTGILYFSTWTVSTRGFFIVLFPLFIYSLLKSRASFKYIPFTLILFIILVLTHHLFYFAIPVVVSYFIVSIFYKLNRHVSFGRIPKNIVYFALPMCFLGMFLIPFFTRTFIEGGSRYEWLKIISLAYGRMIGPLIVFMVGGFGYLLLKRDKNFEDWFLMVVLLILSPLIYINVYSRWGFLPFAFLVIGIALTNVDSVKTQTWKKKYIASLLVVILLLSVIFTGYYQYLHFLNEPNPNKRYMEERTYIGALWIKDSIDIHKNVFAAPRICLRVFATSEVPTFTGAYTADMAYGFVDPDKLEVKLIRSPLSIGFYLHSPYRVVNHTYTDWYVEAIAEGDINTRRSWAYRSTSKYNLSYYVENRDAFISTFTRSVQQTKYSVYDNGKIRIWCLD